MKRHEIITQNELYSTVAFDIEVASITPTLDELYEKDITLYKIFASKYKRAVINKEKDWDKLTEDEAYIKYACLEPVFGQIACISFGYIKKDTNEYKIKSIYQDDETDEKQMLILFNSLIVRFRELGYDIAGFNINGFDIPYVIKRMLIHDIDIPTLFKTRCIKPWDLKFIDLMEIFKFTSKYSSGTFEEMCYLLNVPTPKNTGIAGAEVSQAFHDKRILDIVKYCEEDIRASLDCMIKLS